MSQSFVARAGKRAYEIIRDKGLVADDVKIVAGAAGGPKWLVLSCLDRLLFSSWFSDRQKRLFLIGSSIGSWRFAAASSPDPENAITALEKAYIHQQYSNNPSCREVTEGSMEVMESFLDRSSIKYLLAHPFMRLNFFAVRSKGPGAQDAKLPLVLSLGGAAFANAVSRKNLNRFFEQTLFFHPEKQPPFAFGNGFCPQQVALEEKNLKKALLASGSIPVVMEGVSGITGARPGTYRDGGVVDYHLDIPFVPGDDGLVLFPHYTNRVIPGWFDKKLFYRKPNEKHMGNVLLIGPSPQFVSDLPLSKIPDRKDFYVFAGDDEGRFNCWNTVVKKSQRLADEFMEAVLSGKIKELVQPMI